MGYFKNGAWVKTLGDYNDECYNTNVIEIRSITGETTILDLNVFVSQVRDIQGLIGNMVKKQMHYDGELQRLKSRLDAMEVNHGALP